MAAITRRLHCETLELRTLAAADVAASMEISVQSHNTEGLRAAEVQIHFDNQALKLDGAKIRPGDAWQGTASVVSNVDQSTGVASIFLFSVEPVSTDSGSLVDLQFDVRDDLIADVSSAGLAQLRLNEGALESTATLQTIQPISPEPGQLDSSLAMDVQLMPESSRSEEVPGSDWTESTTSSADVQACQAWEIYNIPQVDESALETVMNLPLSGSNQLSPEPAAPMHAFNAFSNNLAPPIEEKSWEHLF